MTTSELFWTSLGALLATAFAQLGVRVLRGFSRHNLEEICRRNNRPDRFGQILRSHETTALGIEMLATLTAVLAIVTGAQWALDRWQLLIGAGASWLWVISGLGLTWIVGVVWIPWVLSRVLAEGFLFFSWPVWRALAVIAMPLLWGVRLIDTALHRIAGRTPQRIDEETVEEEIRAIVTEGHREGLLEEDAREMIEGVIELGEADASEIMTPRTDMRMLQVETPWEDLLADVIQTGRTRIPVYDKNRDDIVGILYSKDLLPELATGNAHSRTPFRDLLRKAVFVPETKPVDDLLQMFQQTHTHIAVVLDEYGGVSGLVTIEDVLEEIVGEIVDEYDQEEAEEIQKIDEDTCEALGRTHVDEINEAMRIELPDDGDFDTIGGFVLTELGRVPLPGESLVWQDRVQISVLEASKRRIDRVRIRRLGNGQRESA